jgi:diguanylate cyclase (GGDEF)-like protein/PAS domain S-box-containing protein
MLDYKWFDAVYEGVYVLDSNRRIVYFNKSAERITGFKSEDVVGRLEHDNILNPIDENGMQLSLIPRFKEDERVYLQHHLGHRIPVFMKSLPVENGDGVAEVVELFVEESTYRCGTNAKGALDRVTGLSNKGYVENVLNYRLSVFRNFNVPMGVFIVDIDDFEAHNQTYGTAFCDHILKMIGMSFKQVFVDADLIGRWRGDEFIVLYGTASSDILKRVGEKLRLIAENSALRGETFKDVDVSVSVGGTNVRTDDTFEEVMKRLQQNLKTAKSRGGNAFFYK